MNGYLSKSPKLIRTYFFNFKAERFVPLELLQLWQVFDGDSLTTFGSFRIWKKVDQTQKISTESQIWSWKLNPLIVQIFSQVLMLILRHSISAQ